MRKKLAVETEINRAEAMSSPAPPDPSQSATSTPESRERWTPEPSFEDYVQSHPHRAVMVGISEDTYIAELIRLDDALDKGEYRYGSETDLHHKREFAKQALFVDLRRIAKLMKIVNFESAYYEDESEETVDEETEDEETDDPLLMAVFVFENAEDAYRFSDLLTICRFWVVRGEAFLDRVLQK